MGFSLTHILIFAAVGALVLGGGRLSALMGDAAKGMKSFKKGMADEDAPSAPETADDVQPIASRETSLNVRHRPF